MRHGFTMPVAVFALFSSGLVAMQAAAADYVVAQQHPAASDDNPGTPAQ